MLPKYRAWDIHEKKMFTNDQIIIWNNNVYANDGGKLKPDRLMGWSIDDKYLMQSTGLFDKNGVEIFEGDFLKNKDKPDTILICKKSDLQASFRACSTNGMISLTLWHDESRDWTVIGNIHEHPESVEVGHDQ